MTNKYNIGEKVWYMKDNEVVSETVKSIRLLTVSPSRLEIYYGFYEMRYLNSNGAIAGYPSVSESDIFSSKEELLKSL